MIPPAFPSTGPRPARTSRSAERRPDSSAPTWTPMDKSGPCGAVAVLRSSSPPTPGSTSTGTSSVRRGRPRVGADPFAPAAAPVVAGRQAGFPRQRRGGRVRLTAGRRGGGPAAGRRPGDVEPCPAGAGRPASAACVSAYRRAEPVGGAGGVIPCATEGKGADADDARAWDERPGWVFWLVADDPAARSAVRAGRRPRSGRVRGGGPTAHSAPWRSGATPRPAPCD